MPLASAACFSSLATIHLSFFSSAPVGFLLSFFPSFISLKSFSTSKALKYWKGNMRDLDTAVSLLM